MHAENWICRQRLRRTMAIAWTSPTHIYSITRWTAWSQSFRRRQKLQWATTNIQGFCKACAFFIHNKLSIPTHRKKAEHLYQSGYWSRGAVRSDAVSTRWILDDVALPRRPPRRGMHRQHRRCQPYKSALRVSLVSANAHLDASGSGRNFRNVFFPNSKFLHLQNARQTKFPNEMVKHINLEIPPGADVYNPLENEFVMPSWARRIRISRKYLGNKFELNNATTGAQFTFEWSQPNHGSLWQIRREGWWMQAWVNEA